MLNWTRSNVKEGRMSRFFYEVHPPTGDYDKKLVYVWETTQVTKSGIRRLAVMNIRGCLEDSAVAIVNCHLYSFVSFPSL